ncbi:3-hydroxyisobutyrate dehydrogenase [Rhodococcus sp. C3V]|uniref:3-hydroxyisobutyrate dehydrogenase n=1 Tax=Rhodococcus sp. C3V TaxID=3034165 RepID=UPI0023E0C190|nr:3-hydroxyisobutyrate dehydrogenase [Rhodococcus sp. C3V]MDF3319973.1 3-hydroxyisobutyrate dehydrogenase [Rhodococcus sp. C3V]
MANIAWIGLGQMGLPMAANLSAAGHHLTGFDVSTECSGRAAEAGLVTAADIASAVSGVDIVFLSLPHGDIVRDVLTAPDGVLASAQAGTIVIDTSTIDVAQARELHRHCAELGFSFLDAPVSGGISGAAAGTLTVMVGGEESVVEKASPVLESIAAAVIHVGDAGAGQIAKLINNMICGVNLAAVCEGVDLAERLGVDPTVLFDVVSRSSGNSWALSTWYPVPGVVETAASNRDFAPGFTTQLLVKDMGLAVRSGELAGSELRTVRLVRSMFEEHAAGGADGLDCTSLITSLRPSNREIAPPHVEQT